MEIKITNKMTAEQLKEINEFVVEQQTTDRVRETTAIELRGEYGTYDINIDGELITVEVR